MNESIISIFSVFGMPVMIVLIIALFGYLKNAKKYHLAEEIVRSGQPVPESLFAVKDKVSAPITRLQYGLVWVAIGIGLLLFAMFEHGIRSGFVGLAAIPMLIGVAYLITYFVMCKQKPEAEAETADADQK